MKKNILILVISALVLYLSFFTILFAHHINDLIPEATKSIDEAVSSPTKEFAKNYVTLLQSGDVESIKTLTEPEVFDDKFQEFLKQIKTILPNEIPSEIRPIGYNIFNPSGSEYSDITVLYQYTFSTQYFIVEFVMRQTGADYKMRGIHFAPNPDSIENLSKFHFWGKNAVHYVMLCIAILTVTLSLYAFARCIKLPPFKRKWLWAIFTLLGFGRAEFYWTTGAFVFFQNYSGQNVNFDLFKFPTASFSQMLYNPFIVTVSIPLGAIIFLMRYQKIKAQISSNPVKDTE